MAAPYADMTKVSPKPSMRTSDFSTTSGKKGGKKPSTKKGRPMHGGRR